MKPKLFSSKKINVHLFVEIFLLIASLSTPLTAGPFDRAGTEEENFSPSPKLQEEQRRCHSEFVDWDYLRQGPEQATTSFSTPRPSLDESLALTQQSTSLPLREQEREDALAQLKKAFQQAYARGDENHSDWSLVNECIEKLCPVQSPEDGSAYLGRRLSVSDEVVAEEEMLQYLFLTKTLPAIKKTSVVAALRAPNNFKTSNLVDKTSKEADAWQQVRKSFELACKDQHLCHQEVDYCNQEKLDDSYFDQQDAFQWYCDYLQYQSSRVKIESELNALHHDIMQNILEADVTTDDFEERTFSASLIISHYQPLLAFIGEEKKFSGPAVQHKWEQFEQEVAVLVLHDSTQVERIKLWKNRNQVNAIHKAAERFQERAERAPHPVGMHAWEEHLKKETQAALNAWSERKIQLETFQKALTQHKQKLQLTRLAQIEQEIEIELAAAQQAMQYWREQQAQWPLKILESQMKQIKCFYKVALEQYKIEQQLKKNGNPALARYNKKKYLELASEQYQNVSKLFLELQNDAMKEVDSVFIERFNKFKKEFLEKYLFLSTE